VAVNELPPTIGSASSAVSACLDLADWIERQSLHLDDAAPAARTSLPVSGMEGGVVVLAMRRHPGLRTSGIAIEATR
jgi:hypothetical protein